MTENGVDGLSRRARALGLQVPLQFDIHVTEGSHACWRTDDCGAIEKGCLVDLAFPELSFSFTSVQSVYSWVGPSTHNCAFLIILGRCGKSFRTSELGEKGRKAHHGP